jgi:hypothetical protein
MICLAQFQCICLNFLQLDLALKDEKGGDISSFITNGEWDLIGKHIHRKNHFDKIFPNTHTLV